MESRIESIGPYLISRQQLGKGAVCKVLIAQHSVTGVKVALKMINTRKITSEYTRNNLYREGNILGQLQHPHIVQFFEVLKASPFYCIAMEIADGGNLLQLLKSLPQKRFHLESDAQYYSRQMVSALTYLAHKRVVHRNLNIFNVLLDSRKVNIKIADFGLSTTLQDDAHEGKLEIHFVAMEFAPPEMSQTDQNMALYGSEVDVWSLSVTKPSFLFNCCDKFSGVIIFQCLTGQLPFTSPYHDKGREARLRKLVHRGLTKGHEKFLLRMSLDARDLLQQMLEVKPAVRIPWDEICRHPWLTNAGKRGPVNWKPSPTSISLANEIIRLLSTKLGNAICESQLRERIFEPQPNEYTAMFEMMCHEEKCRQGYFEEDHTTKKGHDAEWLQEEDGISRQLSKDVHESLFKFAVMTEQRKSRQDNNEQGVIEAMTRKLLAKPPQKKNKMKKRSNSPKDQLNALGILVNVRPQHLFPPNNPVHYNSTQNI